MNVIDLLCCSYFTLLGKYGIKKARLEQITTPLDLFDTLREKELLNEMNIITLQALLWVLPRRDLQKKYVEFAESLGSSIHFVVPRDSPGTPLSLSLSHTHTHAHTRARTHARVRVCLSQTI